MSFLKYKIKKLFKKKGRELLDECLWISIMLILFPLVIIVFIISDMAEVKKSIKMMSIILILSTIFNILQIYLASISFWLLIPTLLIAILTISMSIIINEASSTKLTIEEIRDLKLNKLMKK